jgi:hypothetical protein
MKKDFDHILFKRGRANDLSALTLDILTRLHFQVGDKIKKVLTEEQVRIFLNRREIWTGNGIHIGCWRFISACEMVNCTP